MPRRTTLVLEDTTYTRLVEESLRRYGTSRAISKVVDKMVEASMTDSRRQDEKGLIKLLYSRKVAKTTEREFEKDRREFSRKFEELQTSK